MKKILLFLVAAVATISCSTDNMSDANSSANNDNSIELSIPVSVSSVSVSSSIDTRVAVSDNNDGGYTVKWSADDKMGAWSNELFNNASFNKFVIETGDFDENESIFTGKIAFGQYAETIRFVHPYSTATLYKGNEKDDKNYCNAFDIDLSAQKVNADLTHLGANSYMVSNVIDFGKSSAEKSLTPEMSHMGAAIDLNIACVEAQENNYTLESVEVSYEAMPSTVSVNLRKAIDEEYFETLTCDPITLTVASYKANEKGAFPVIPFNVFPFTFANGGEMTIKATFTDADDNFYTGTRVLTATEDAVIERATRNSLYAVITDALVGYEAPATAEATVAITPTDMQSAAGLTGTGNPKKVTIGDLRFDFSNMGLFGTTLEYRYYNNSTITIECDYGISSIDFGTSSMKVSIEEGDGSFDSGKWTGNATKVSLLVTTGSTVKTTEPITITYNELVAPSIKAIDPTKLEFETAGGEQDVELTVKYGEDKKITAVSNNDQFTTSISGTTLTVTAQANATGAAIEGEITISIEGGNSVTLPVSQIGASGNSTYILVESTEDITDGVYILACDRGGLIIADGSEDSNEKFMFNINGNGYYTKDDKSIKSNTTTDKYAVTIEVASDGVYVKAGDDSYLKHTSGTGIDFTSTKYAWKIGTNHGIYLYSNTDDARALAYNHSSPRFGAYNPSSYSVANLYKKQ